jgi:hypothetical protein
MTGRQRVANRPHLAPRTGAGAIGRKWDAERDFSAAYSRARAIFWGSTLYHSSHYPGAKPYFRVDDHVDDADFIARLFRATEAEVPEPKPKKPRSR